MNLNIKLDSSIKLALTDDPATNYWASHTDLSSLSGKSSDQIEGGGESLAIYLNTGAKAGDTITLVLGANSDKFKVILGDTVLPANGAVITLLDGQTDVRISLVQVGDISADISTTISATYSSTVEGTAVSISSNSWGINVHDAGEISRTYIGDQRARIIGAGQKVRGDIPPGDPIYGTYWWAGTTWATDGSLIGGLPAPDFEDVIYASAGADKIYGLGGNDALSGGAGNDIIEGGAGDDLIGGGAGSDNIKGGDGNDFILSSATLSASQRSAPTDSWSPPANELVHARGARWGIYLETQSGSPVTVWSGSDSPEGDVVDGGAGNDHIIASVGGDRVLGGTDDDLVFGMGGGDILEGGSGKDNISGDCIIKPDFMNSLQAQFHGADFIDGGTGDDTLTGGGGSDDIYGGADNDELWGDSSGNTAGVEYVTLAFHGSDFLDGAIDLVAACARYSGVSGRIDHKNWLSVDKKHCFQRCLERSKAKISHAHSVRPAGHKWLGRRTDNA